MKDIMIIVTIALAAISLAALGPGSVGASVTDHWYEGTVEKVGPDGLTVKVSGYRIGTLYRRPPPSVEVGSSKIPGHVLSRIRPGDHVEFKQVRRSTEGKELDLIESFLLLEAAEPDHLALFYGDPIDFPLPDRFVARSSEKGGAARIRMIRFEPIGRTEDGLFNKNRLILTMTAEDKELSYRLEPGTFAAQEGVTVGFYFAYAVLPGAMGTGSRNHARLLITGRSGETPDLKRVEVGPKGGDRRNREADRMLARADDLFISGNFKGARSEYLKALQIDPASPRAHVGMGKACRAEHILDKAEQHFRKAIEIDPSYYPAYRGLAQVAEAQGDDAEALDALRRYLELGQADGGLGPEAVKEAEAKIEALEAGRKEQK